MRRPEPERSGKPLAAGDLLKDLVRDLDKAPRRQKVADALSECLEEEWVEQIEFLRLRNGVLSLEVQSAPLLAELRNFHMDDIRRACERVLEPERIHRVQLTLGGIR
ncbi:MAG: DciA family protein [Planctomycetota bacterium]